MLHGMWRSIAVTVVCLPLLGCGGASGPKLAAAKGTVTLNGKPLSGATVTLAVEGVKSQPAIGVTNAEGKFKLTTGGRSGAPVGTCLVSVSKPPPAPANAPDMTNMKPEDMQKMQMANQGVTPVEKQQSEVPARYGDSKASGLKVVVEVDASKNDFEFPLVSE